ncbi:hypothetical protein TNCV_2471681 [Trichonephila clavipes]|nr:hypothetical protein TNCV_2471681 [Trichonephila clavipes]
MTEEQKKGREKENKKHNCELVFTKGSLQIAVFLIKAVLSRVVISNDVVRSDVRSYGLFRGFRELWSKASMIEDRFAGLHNIWQCGEVAGAAVP